MREERKLLDSLVKRGLVGESATLDDILSLTVEDMLSRRLQTMVFKKGLAVSPLHARQLVVHGHVMVGDRLVRVPGYIVRREEEASLRLVGMKESQGKPPAAPQEAAPAAQG